TSRRRQEVAESLGRLRRGDVVRVDRGRSTGYAVVIDTGQVEGFGHSGPSVLTTERKVRRLTAQDLHEPLRAVTTVRVPKSFDVRTPAARRNLASSLRNALGAAEPAGARRERGGRAAADDAELAQLRARLRAHPCHGCPEREDHARWAERWARLSKEHGALMRRIEGRTGTIARQFDEICTILVGLGYLDTAADGDLTVTGPGRTLRRLYAESDLLLAECLRRGAWSGLDAPGLAAVVSAVVYSARREQGDTEPRIPGGPQGRLARAVDATVRIWSELDDLEHRHHLEATAPVDLGLVEVVHRWASGRSLDAVLRGSELAAGDFVRWCKQVIDVLDQLSQAAPEAELRTAADRAVGLLRRGVVAYSSV
ncbi:MAG: DEAD/DEAH box helicase, partial [Cellulomonadaceae bacterium]